MPVICDVCGSSNRENAMFCVGCAGRLPGFVSSGPSALEAMMALRPPSHALAPGKKAKVGGAAVSILPAEAPAFWLRLGLLGLAMLVGFIGWYMYVTRKVSPPPAATEAQAAPAAPPATALAPPAPAPAPPRVEAQAAVAPPAPSPAPVAPRAQSELPAAAPAIEMAPAPAVASAPAAPARPDTTSTRALAEAPTARAQPRAAADTRAATARQPRAASRSEPSGEPSPEALRRALALAEAEDDAEAPRSSISYGSGSTSGAARQPSRSFNDAGPPTVAGPGPLYEATRPAVRAPLASANDLGPPISIGPGPLVDYSTRGAGPR